jgi:hypothetical protein
MGAVKEFTTALREVTDPQDDEEGWQFKVDGHELTCYPPAEGQLAVLMASTSRHTSVSEQIAGIINFFVEVMDGPSHAYLVGRLLDRNDPFGLNEVTEIMGWMVEEWSGRPTQPSSGSTRSRSSGGRRSTPRTSPSISSGSPLTAS